MRNYLRFPHDVHAASIYSWSIPALLDAYGAGATKLPGGGVIAIGELGGAYYPRDATLYFKSVGVPEPSIAVVGQQVADPGNADVEVALDYQMAAVAHYVLTGHPATIRIYFGANTNAGFEDAIKQAAADECDVMSWSWGAAESSWGRPAAESLDAVAAAALGGGMVLTAAAGDSGYEDGTSEVEVDFPASSPHFIACGGTRKLRTGEVIWRDAIGATGGGYSKFFARPSWQVGVPELMPGRMVSDVAGDADPVTGVQIVANGRPMVIGGTSAVAPMWAGLLAAFGRKLGDVHPTLYGNPGGLMKITRGNDGKWPATVCCGLGVPIVNRLTF